MVRGLTAFCNGTADNLLQLIVAFMVQNMTGSLTRSKAHLQTPIINGDLIR